MSHDRLGADELPEPCDQVTDGLIRYGDWIKHPDSGKWWRVHYDWVGGYAWEIEDSPIEPEDTIMRPRTD